LLEQTSKEDKNEVGQMNMGWIKVEVRMNSRGKERKIAINYKINYARKAVKYELLNYLKKVQMGI
jgi:hypothetical protein